MADSSEGRTSTTQQQQLLPTAGWRRDPAESYSDFEFEIAVVCSPPPDVGGDKAAAADGDDNNASSSSSAAAAAAAAVRLYHTHKFILSCSSDGGRKSAYFESMFRGGFAETNGTRRCRILLPAVAAAAVVPHMLDYLYLPTRPLQIDTESAVPLYFLSDYFGIDSMQTDVIDFVKKDLSAKNATTKLYYTYYNQLKLLHGIVPESNPILIVITHHCARRLHKLRVSVCCKSTLIKETDVRFWLMVLEKTKIIEERVRITCSHLNFLIKNVCEQNINRMTPAEFDELTREDYLPRIEEECANQFLVMQSTVMDRVQPEEDEDGAGNDNENKGNFPFDWGSKIDLIYREDYDEDADNDYVPDEETDNTDDEELESYRNDAEPYRNDARLATEYADYKDFPLLYDDDMEDNELLGERTQSHEYDVDVYFDKDHAVDEQTNFKLRCIRALCLGKQNISGNLDYFSKHPELLSLLYQGTLDVSRKRECAWLVQKESLEGQLSVLNKKECEKVDAAEDEDDGHVQELELASDDDDDDSDDIDDSSSDDDDVIDFGALDFADI